MSNTFEEIDERPAPQREWSAIVANNPSDFADLLEIIIPAHSTTLRYQHIKWQSRNDVDLPQRGDKCLAILDDNNEYWVVAWWPF